MTVDAPPNTKDLYLDLLIRCISNTIYQDANTMEGVAAEYDPALRENGQDWPRSAHSMMGLKRLRNLRELTEAALREGIAGDFIETGVWRGGGCILMRGVLAAHGVADRTVYVADSFRGLPEAQADRYPADAGSTFHTFEQLAVPRAAVEDAFRAYGLLDGQVAFVEGWFEDTLPKLPAPRLALLRLDGDLYSSTIQALDALYPRLSPGGYAIVDDYGAVPACRRAVDDYRARFGIADPIQQIDWTGIWWRKGEAAKSSASESPVEAPDRPRSSDQKPHPQHQKTERPGTPALPVDFDARTYLFLNPDVAAAGVDPAEHYLRFGVNEGRRYRYDLTKPDSI